MQAVATRTSAGVDESPAVGAVELSRPRSPTSPCVTSSAARSVLLGDRTYIEHARAEEAMSFRQLEASMERWRALLGGVRARGLTTIGLVISDPMAFADVFLGAVAAGFWVAPLDPSMPAGGSGGLAVTLARTGVDVVLADRPGARRH